MLAKFSASQSTVDRPRLDQPRDQGRERSRQGQDKCDPRNRLRSHTKPSSHQSRKTATGHSDCETIGSWTGMSVWTGNRFPYSKSLRSAIAETRLAARAAPRVVRHLAPIVAWAVASIFLGLVVGLAAVILPPLGAFGIVVIAGVVLLWVMPDLPLVSPRLIRKAFFVMLIADLCIPFYYMVQFAGLALDFCPPPRHLRSHRAVPHRHCSFVRSPTSNC